MKNRIIFDFHLFDGEGGMGAEGTASQSAPKQEEKQIQYGKSSTGDGQTPSQVGSDSASEGSSPDEEFAALIGKGGKYHDQFGQRVSEVIQDRFKNQANLQAQVDEISDGLSPLFMNYGLDTGDYEGLINAVKNDDAFYQAGAERAGLEVEQYKQNLKLQADAERGRKITEAYEREQAKQAKYHEWEADAAALQEAFPAFDLGHEIENNEMFANLIDNGVDVRTAFLSTHVDQILDGSSAYAQKTATQNVINTIQQRAARPIEGALGHAPAIERRSDPSKLTKEDFERIDAIVEAGGTVAF